jgi:cytochrome c peroxidase
LPVAMAIDEKTALKRNTPTIWNSVLQTRQFFDSRADILENQLDEVVHNADEMKGSLKQSVEDLKNHAVYSQLFKTAYPNQKLPITAYNIANAISSYIRTLVAMNSPFDQFMNGTSNRLTGEEKKGFNLFAGKAKCATCHFLPLFNGLVPPQFNETESEILGVPDRKNKKGLDQDFGKFNFTKSEIHRFSFKTPTLRNVALTAPYMHNGVFKTLEEVLEFYNKGGGKGLKIPTPNQTLPSDRLNLSKKEMKQVIAFLKTLTDTAYTYKEGSLH